MHGRAASTGRHLPLDGGGWEGVAVGPDIGANTPTSPQGGATKTLKPPKLRGREGNRAPSKRPGLRRATGEDAARPPV